MFQGKFVFAQLFEYINRYEFDKCVDRYQGDYKTKDFSCWSQFLYMAFGQFTHRESCTDIITCLNAQRNSVYHLGLKQIVAVSTLTRANENRDWRIYSDFANYLLSITRPVRFIKMIKILHLNWTIQFMLLIPQQLIFV
ncbi:MAG: DUF4372 domain-containing protein [Bacteroidia bacterium]|nr:DUF4372 domain-containing protein [Bacteroidia bacterium]